MILSPWIAYYLCVIIPGKVEEPYILSGNLFISALATFILSVYLTFSLNRSGFRTSGQEADLFLMLSVPYHLILSVHLSKKRMSLSEIPAFRMIQGGIILSISLFILLSLFSKIRIYIFSYLSFNNLLIIVGILMFFAYIGWLEIFENDQKKL
jgi:hypothetical protein